MTAFLFEIIQQVKRISSWLWFPTATKGSGQAGRECLLSVSCLHDENKRTSGHDSSLKSSAAFRVLLLFFHLTQKTVCHNISGSLPAAVRPGCFLPIPSLHWCILRGGEVCLRLLRPGQTHRLSQHYSKTVQLYETVNTLQENVT